MLADDIQVKEGPQALQQALQRLIAKAKQDPAFAARDHFIHYQLGGQQALMKVDLREAPVLCWHVDLLGRTATPGIKNAAASVGEFIDLSGEENRRAHLAFTSGQSDRVDLTLRHIRLEEARQILNKHNRTNYLEKHPQQAVLNEPKKVTIASHRAAFAFFKKAANHPQPEPTEKSSPTPGKKQGG